MKINTTTLALLVFLLAAPLAIFSQNDFQGKAYYSSKSTMDLSRFSRGGQMSEQQKKQMEERMKPFLEKTFILTFNKEESIFKEDEKLSAPSAGGGGRGFGFMSSFSSGPQYKNIKNKIFIQDQEFFGKQFLIKEEMTPFNWKMEAETKQIGKYTAFKATVLIPDADLNWMRVEPPRRGDNRNETESDTATNEELVEEPKMVEVIAWYTPMVPVSQGPGEYWGLPGLILELSAGNTVMLCSKIVMNTDDKEAIRVPDKGKEVTKNEYSLIISEKMQEMRDNRGRNGGGGTR